MAGEQKVTTVWDLCADCGNQISITSEAGNPAGLDYDLKSAPAAVVADLIGKQVSCLKCGRVHRVFGCVSAFFAPVDGESACVNRKRSVDGLDAMVGVREVVCEN